MWITLGPSAWLRILRYRYRVSYLCFTQFRILKYESVYISVFWKLTNIVSRHVSTYSTYIIPPPYCCATTISIHLFYKCTKYHILLSNMTWRVICHTRTIYRRRMSRSRAPTSGALGFPQPSPGPSALSPRDCSSNCASPFFLFFPAPNVQSVAEGLPSPRASSSSFSTNVDPLHLCPRLVGNAVKARGELGGWC